MGKFPRLTSNTEKLKLTHARFQKFSSEERNIMFEKLYTNTLFYLAQVFGVRGDNKQAAAHCHITLQRQLEAEVD